MANKKGFIETIKNDVFDIYGKENIIPILCKGAAIALIYILWEVGKLEPLEKPLLEPLNKNSNNTRK